MKYSSSGFSTGNLTFDTSGEVTGERQIPVGWKPQ